ncbi:WG repeat-containing protein [Kaistella yonginensis]|uniref:WG repeat-containing protein n=1 Tax=Kaistella yonginensis TaxID=658267 RepID=UPI0025B56BAB|nr:WG repeat-containing protein [Kaistella yonginensis]MDN3606765.1 WG repeat-containing protein [Kaistella yonginensis]
MNYPILKIEKLDDQTPLTDICLYEGVFVYSSKGLFGLIADDFGSIIPPIYEEIIPAFDFHFWARKNHKWKLYNFKNIEINGIEFKHVTTFCNEYACVSRNGNNFGFMNRKGEIKITDYYLKGKHLGKSFFAVGKNIRGKVKYAVIDLQEHVIIPFIFDEIPTFTEVILLLLKRRKPLREWLQL